MLILKDLNLKDIIYRKVWSNITTSSSKENDQPIDSDIKRHQEISKLTTRQGEDYTTGFLLDYDYIKHHRL